MADCIKARVFRFDRSTDAEPYYDEYLLEAEEATTVLALITRIQGSVDRTLSFRDYCCGLQMCRGCLVRINQKKRFACLTLVEPGASVVIEPVAFPESHIKDLAVEQTV